MKRLLSVLLLLPVFAMAQHNYEPRKKVFVVKDTVYQVTVTNILGQTVYSQAFHSDDVEVKAPGLPKGFYIVKINSQDRRHFYNDGVFDFYIRISRGDLNGWGIL